MMVIKESNNNDYWLHHKRWMYPRVMDLQIINTIMQQVMFLGNNSNCMSSQQAN
jgi:hypothetical protein